MKKKPVQYSNIEQAFRIILPLLSIISLEVLYVKDNNMKKGSKGFYAALGISAVMIGSACFFAYDQGEKLKEKPVDEIISVPEAPVDRKSTGIPKTTTAVVTTAPPIYTTNPPITTAAVTQPVPRETLPAAEIIISDPPEPTKEVMAGTPESPEAELVGTAKLENVKPPLADTGNILNPFSGSELVKNETTGSWQTHNGVDYAAEVGAEVCAISSGEITEINTDPLWGVTVTVNHHNGYISKYCGLGTELSVQQGDTVASGSVIGVVGQTADIESAVPPHLHMELRHNGELIDPNSVLSS